MFTLLLNSMSISILNYFEKEETKRIRKIKTLKSTDFLRNSSHTNLIEFKKRNDIYGVISNIITYHIDYETTPPHLRTSIESFTKKINHNINHLNEDDMNLLEKFIKNSFETERDLYLLTFLFLNKENNNNNNLLSHKPKNLLEEHIHLLLTRNNY